MIFVTVGTQGPFDRLVRTVDEWAGLCGRDDVFAQIGPSDYRARHINAKRFVHPQEFRKNVEAASVIVAHAGMGSIITALEFGKRVIVMPRRSDLNEQRNDHQIATAKTFAQLGHVVAAFDEQELREKLDRIDDFREMESLNMRAPSGLIDTIRAFIEEAVEPAQRMWL